MSSIFNAVFSPNPIKTLRPQRRPRWPLFVLAMAALAMAPAAWAHKASDAYLNLHVQGSVLDLRWDIALRDLAREGPLDANADGSLTWGEVRAAWPQIEALAAQNLHITADGGACVPLAGSSPQLDTHSDGRYAVLRVRLACAAPPQRLSLDYRLFADSDAGHRGILRVVDAAQAAAPSSEVRLLVPGDSPALIDLAPQASRRAAAPSGLQAFGGFVLEGLRHIGAGLDHILFLATLIMVAVWRREGKAWVPREKARAAWREILHLVTAFTLAHSLTLGLAAAGVLAPPTRWVESLIALSVLVAALDNLRPFVPGPRWLMVSVFGLVHGFGFAGPLQDLGLARGDLALPLLGFNLGVELGQLLLVALLLPLACWWRASSGYRWAVVGAGSVATAGLAVVWLMERSLELSLLPL